MKKILSIILLISFLQISNITFAKEVSNIKASSDVPQWEDYVPTKYQNPRPFPSKGKNIAELATGIVLTELLITAPVGVPMIVHSTTKMKNQGYYKKKQTFEKGLDEAEKILNPQERQEYYAKLLKDCKMTKKYNKKD